MSEIKASYLLGARGKLKPLHLWQIWINLEIIVFMRILIQQTTAIVLK